MITLLEFLQKKHIDIDIDPQFIDLGLPSGTLWCDRNIGAKKPEDFGDYFAWGETETKDYFSENNYKFYNKRCGIKKYNEQDKKIQLDLEDDVAHVIMGGDCVIPTSRDILELIDNCKISILDDYYALLISNENNNQLIIPLSGYRSVLANNHFDKKGERCYIVSNEVQYDLTRKVYRIDKNNTNFGTFANLGRYCGTPIRAIQYAKK